jgi:5-methylcytosine-specific restriction protein A
MPIGAKRPCTYPGCGRLVPFGQRRCEAHPAPTWAKRPDAPKRVAGRKLQRLRAELFSERPLCAECERLGRVRLATQRDHVVPLAEGGRDDESNVQGLCDECHAAKSEAERVRGAARARRCG